MGDFAEIALGQNQFLQQFMTRVGLPQPPTTRRSAIGSSAVGR
jgi:hypothetical protein